MGWRNGRAARNKNRREKCNKASTAIGLISLVWFGVGVVICRDGVVEMGFAAKGLNREGGALTVFNTTSNATVASGDPADAGTGLYNFLGGFGMIVIPLCVIACCCVKGNCTAHNMRAIFGGGGFRHRRRRHRGLRGHKVSAESAVIAGAIIGGAMIAAAAADHNKAPTHAVQPQPQQQPQSQ
jgi:hypothetical protein